MVDDKEVKKSVDAFQIFAREFGPDDIYNRIILEEVFKAIMNFIDDKELKKKDDDIK